MTGVIIDVNGAPYLRSRVQPKESKGESASKKAVRHASSIRSNFCERTFRGPSEYPSMKGGAHNADDQSCLVPSGIVAPASSLVLSSNHLLVTCCSCPSSVRVMAPLKSARLKSAPLKLVCVCW
jgi:hypothetical protein